MNYRLAYDTVIELYRYLKDLSSNPQVQETFKNHPLYDQLLKISNSRLDSRVAILCANDVINCFKLLGNKFDPTRDETLILSIFITLVMINVEENFFETESMARKAVSMGLPLEVYRQFEENIKIGYQPRRLLLVDLLREEVDDDVVNKLVILIYRLVLLMAEADDDITPAEREWLTELLNFSRPEHSDRVQEDESDFLANIHDEEEMSTLEELASLIGLQNVKREMENIYNLIKIQTLREQKGLKSSKISYHCVFTGNPGTGKTTVARILARIYKDLGILEKGHLVEADRSGLVAEYVGQTAVKTNKIIDSALDGVLFIDEAYSLVRGDKNDFGMEAIATLLKRMEDDRDRLVVIIAGYTDEMKTFIDANPGLRSRFNRYIQFDDYDEDDLVDIFMYNIDKYDYHLTDEAIEKLRHVMAEAVARKDKNFGNARFVRNLFEKTLENQARRLVKQSELGAEALSQITDSDIKE